MTTQLEQRLLDIERVLLYRPSNYRVGFDKREGWWIQCTMCWETAKKQKEIVHSDKCWEGEICKFLLEQGYEWRYEKSESEQYPPRQWMEKTKWKEGSV